MHYTWFGCDKVVAVSLPAYLEEFLHGQPDVSGDLPEQGGRDVPAGMRGHRSAAAVGMSVLTVRAPLSNELEAEARQ